MFWILRERRYFLQLLQTCTQLLHRHQQEILQGRALNNMCLHMQVMQCKGLLACSKPPTLLDSGWQHQLPLQDKRSQQDTK